MFPKFIQKKNIDIKKLKSNIDDMLLNENKDDSVFLMLNDDTFKETTISKLNDLFSSGFLYNHVKKIIKKLKPIHHKVTMYNSKELEEFLNEYINKNEKYNLDDKIEKYKEIIISIEKDLKDTKILLFEVIQTTLINIFIKIYDFKNLSRYLYLHSYDNMRKLRDGSNFETFKNKIFEKVLLDFDFLDKILIEYFDNKFNFINNELKLEQILRLDHDNGKIKDKIAILEFFYSVFFAIKINSDNYEELDFSQNTLMDEKSVIINTALYVNESVKKLNYNSNKLGSSGLWSLGRLLIFSHNIIDLDISYNSINDNNIEALMKSVLDHKIYLQRLNISNNQFTLKSGIFIARIIENCPHLNHLNLSKNPNLSIGLLPILNILKKHCTIKVSVLQYLVIYNIGMNSECFSSLAELFKNSGCQIKQLNISENKLNNRGGMNLIQGISVNKSLQELIMYNCEINNEIGEYIYDMILSNQSLSVINLYNNSINSINLFKKILSVLKGFDKDNSEKYSNKIKYFDISKNKLKIPFKELEILIFQLEAEMIDISQNIDQNPIDEKTIEKIREFEKKTKLIY